MLLVVKICVWHKEDSENWSNSPSYLVHVCIMSHFLYNFVESCLIFWSRDIMVLVHVSASCLWDGSTLTEGNEDVEGRLRSKLILSIKILK